MKKIMNLALAVMLCTIVILAGFSSPVKAQSPAVAASISISTDLSIPSGFYWFLSPYDVVEYDTSGLWNGLERFVVSQAGYYRVTAKVRFANSGAGTMRGIRICKNNPGQCVESISTNFSALWPTDYELVKTFKLVAGDSIFVTVKHDTGATLNIQQRATYFQIELVGQ